MIENRTRIVSAGWFIGKIFLLGVLVYLIFFPIQPFSFDSQTVLSNLKVFYHSHVPASIHPYIYFLYDHINHSYMGVASQYLMNPYFYLGVACIFMLERLIPAKKGQKVFSLGMFQDLLWFVLSFIVLGIVFMSIYGGILNYLYDEYLTFLTIKAVATWPIVIQTIMAILFTDLLTWFHHFAKHKVKVFWFFHAVHHSQRELNLFTDGRFHIVEQMIASTLVFIPDFMFPFQGTGEIYTPFILIMYTKVYHANLRTNYGFFKYFMVTPQSHRIHHSIDERHWGKNFGLYTTIWDRVFGTLHNNYDEYPDTGIDDNYFPLERSVKGLSVLKNFLAQFLYPFRQVASFIKSQ